MKLIIIVTLIAIASSSHMKSFLSMEGTSFCASVAPADMCGCQDMGCSFNSDNGQCAAIGSVTGSTVFTAGILAQCSQATTEESCLSHVGWHDRYGTKISCSWCSTACVHSEHADDTCKGSGKLEEFLATWTHTTTNTTAPKEEGPTTDEIDNRIIENGGLSGDETFLGITLAWDNCNDLDLELYTPDG